MSPSTETQLERRRQPAATAEAAAECGLLKGEKVRRDGGRDDKRLRTTKLQSFDEIPHYLQFNRYVREHYRPLADWQGCLRSLTYLHNETVNIFTHVVPIVVILAYVRTLLPWSEIDIPLLPTIHVVSSLSPWIGSTIYHLFMNHEGGHRMYNVLLNSDMVGIWVAQNGGSLTCIVATIYCWDLKWHILALTAFGLAATFSLYKAITAKCPWQRRFSFVLPFLFRLGVMSIRLMGRAGGDERSLKHLLAQDVVAIVGAYIGASNIPERWFAPGRLDLAFNSHHIMHVLVVGAAYLMHQAVAMDLVWMTKINNGIASCSS